VTKEGSVCLCLCVVVLRRDSIVLSLYYSIVDMGAYLSTPVTEKESEGGGDACYEYGVCAMQGWRTDMEDAHVVALDMVKGDAEKGDMALFGVFDGHGGKEVAKFCALRMAETLLGTEGFQKGDMAEALREAYLKMDEIMVRREHMEELEALKGGDDEGIGEEGLKKGETAMMLDSAQLPEAFLDAFGISKDSGYVFKVVKSADGQLNVQNVLDREGNELGAADDSMEEEEEEREDVQDPKRRREGASPEGPFDQDASRDPLDVVEDAIDHNQPLELEELHSADETPWHGPAAGCTAVCAVVTDNHLVVANAGDSRCILSRAGKAVALTEDHKPTNEDEFARIMKAGGFVADGRVNGSLNLSRALGDLEYKQVSHLPPEEQMVTANPEVRKLRLTPDDEFLILACDGIWDVLTNEEAVAFVRSRLLAGKTPREICEEACDHCLAEDTSGCGKGCDNMSIVISVFKNSKFAASLARQHS